MPQRSVKFVMISGACGSWLPSITALKVSAAGSGLTSISGSVTVQQPLSFEGYQAQRDLQNVLDDIERAVIADGPDHSYMAHVEKGSRKIVRKKNADVCEASINFLVDYDFNEA